MVYEGNDEAGRHRPPGLRGWSAPVLNCLDSQLSGALEPLVTASPFRGLLALFGLVWALLAVLGPARRRLINRPTCFAHAR